jgi:hypothetical protein
MNRSLRKESYAHTVMQSRTLIKVMCLCDHTNAASINRMAFP